METSSETVISYSSIWRNIIYLSFRNRRTSVPVSGRPVSPTVWSLFHPDDYRLPDEHSWVTFQDGSMWCPHLIELRSAGPLGNSRIDRKWAIALTLLKKWYGSDQLLEDEISPLLKGKSSSIEESDKAKGPDHSNRSGKNQGVTKEKRLVHVRVVL